MRKIPRILKTSKIISFAVVAVMLCGLFSFTVSAVNPIVIDFSKSDDLMDDIGGQGDMDVVNDSGRRVLFAECTDGYDPADDPDGTGTMGDLYASVSNFADYGVDADAYQWMKISVKNQSAAPFFEFHFESPTKGYNVETSVNLEINPNSDYTSYVYNVTDQCKKYYPKRPEDVDDPNVYPDHWHGAITNLRLDFMYYEESGGHAKTGDKIYIEYIAFFDTKEAADAWTFTPARTAAQYDAEQTLTEAPTERVPNTAAPTEAPTTETITEAPADGDTTATDAATTSANDDTSGNNMILWIIIAAVAVVVIIVIVVIVTRKKK